MCVDGAEQAHRLPTLRERHVAYQSPPSTISANQREHLQDPCPFGNKGNLTGFCLHAKTWDHPMPSGPLTGS
eukprot:scaffold46475_cov24-Tisochrysis_lutea.AAC.2